VSLFPILKQLSLLTLVLGLSGTGMAQHALTGRVIDEQGDPLSYATVALLQPGDSILKYFGVTDHEGIYRMKNIKEGTYLMQYSFVGMETRFDMIDIYPSGGDDLGDQVMRATPLDEVTIVEEYVPITFRSDTVEYNSKAFTTQSHAVVEDLLKKIPGIEVDESGNMKAMGEDVVNVRVDGKEFFGKDPKVATRNLPADAVDKVQVYDKRSEEAEFTGIDDGVRERTINLMLNEDHRKGYFGNVGAGIGTGQHYSVGGKVYRFSEKLQSALLGMVNNINEFGYTEDPGKQWGARIEGENRSLAGGLNLSYNMTGNNRYFMSYLASHTKKILEQDISTENFLERGTYYQQSELSEEGKTQPHKLNFGVRHQINKQHNLIIDGHMNLSSNINFREGLTHTGFEDSLINTLYNTTNSESTAIDASAEAVYNAKFNEGKTQFKTELSALYHQNKSLLNWRDTIILYHPDSMDLYVQFRDEHSDRVSFSVKPTLVQKIKQFWYLSAGVRLGTRAEHIDRQQEIDREGGIPLDTLLPPFHTQEIVVAPSVSLKRNSNKSQIEFSMQGRWSQFDKVLDGNQVDRPGYFNFLPGFNYEYKYRKGRRINFRYHSSVNMPPVNQLYPVASTLNLLSIYKGNMDLTPELSHNLSFSWWYFDQFSFTSLFTRLGAVYTKNKTGWSQSTNDQLITLVTPVNTPDQRSVYSYISFSTPIRALGMNVNLVSHESWDRGLNIINGTVNTQSNFIHSLKLRFENRKKEKWDAAIGGAVSITDANFSIASMNTVYFNTSYFTDIRFTPNKKWSFETEASVVNYNSKSFEEAVNIPLLTAGISYYFLKGERAAFTLRGYDLLNKQVGFERISLTNYLMQREWNTIGRYVMLEFKLRIGS